MHNLSIDQEEIQQQEPSTIFAYSDADKTVDGITSADGDAPCVQSTSYTVMSPSSCARQIGKCFKN